MTVTYPQGDPASALIDYRSRRRQLGIGVAVFMALVVLVVTLKIVQGVFFTPESTVRAFFQALADRDAGAAGGLVTPAPGRELAGEDLRGDAVLKSSGYSPPMGLRVEPAAAGEDDQATVNVSYLLAGQPQRRTFTLKRDERATAGPFRAWHIVEGAIEEVYVRAETAETVLVAGTPAIVSRGLVNAFGYPGAYQVTLPEQPLLRADPVTAYPGVDRHIPVALLRPTVKPTAQGEVDRQVRTFLDQCSESPGTEDTNCPRPWAFLSSPDLTQVKILRYPTCEITISQGQVLVRGEFQAGVQRKPPYGYSGTSTYVVSGIVTATDGAVVFQPE
ncbi:hypothetical protein [Nonomuraea bangladeshensis]|uniref:hypothetical protein n=1 Tax=Nonomuraea bangladeshensis TaxID=404385 RepID=UPI003C2BDFD1